MAVCVGAILAVLPTRTLGFVHDDRALIANSDKLGDLSTLPTALVSDLFWLSDGVRPSPYWRPWISLSYYLDHLLGDGEAWAFHLHNGLLAVLLALVIWLSCGRGGRGALVAGLVLLHPAFVEPVANVTARTDLYVALLGTVAVLWRSRFGTPALVLALLCKETAVLIPLIWMLQDLGTGERVLHSLRRAGRGLGLVAGWLGLRALFVGGRATGALWEGWGGIPGRLGVAAQRLAAPGPGPRPDVDLSHLSPLPASVGLLVSVSLAAVCIWVARRSGSRVGVALAMVLGPLVLTAGLAGPNIRMADGLLAWALVGVGLLLGQLPRPALACLVPVVAVLAAGHQARVRVWQSPETLWRAALAATPEDPRVQLKAGRIALQTRPRAALALSRPIQSHPDARLRREGHELASRALFAAQRSAEDDALLRTHLRAAAQPQDAEAGWACQARCVWDDLPGDAQAATRADVCLAAVALGHASGDVWNTLGILRAQQGDLQQAEIAFANAVALEPDRPVFEQNLAEARRLSAP